MWLKRKLDGFGGNHYSMSVDLMLDHGDEARYGALINEFDGNLLRDAWADHPGQSKQGLNHEIG